MANTQVVERQRGTRSEHSPKAVDGSVVEPGTLPPDDEDEDTHADVSDVKVKFEADDLLRQAGATVLPQTGQGTQRHGIVEQRKGVAVMDENNEFAHTTEQWRCQCGQRFQGKTAADTERLAIIHLHRFDPDVPAPKK